MSTKSNQRQRIKLSNFFWRGKFPPVPLIAIPNRIAREIPILPRIHSRDDIAVEVRTGAAVHGAVATDDLAELVAFGEGGVGVGVRSGLGLGSGIGVGSSADECCQGEGQEED